MDEGWTAPRISGTLFRVKARPFAQTGRDVSEIGLGAWQLGGDCWGDVDEAAAQAILATALEAGITFFDTADVYGGGLSEERIGRFLKEQKRDDVFVATKLGRGSGLYPDNYSYARMRACTEASLRRLDRDALDLIQLHCIPTEALRKGKAFDWLRQLRQEGLIHAFGASVESMEEAQICLEEDGLASLQIIFNLFRPKAVDELFEQARERNVALIVRLPLASGLLSGKLTADHAFAENDHRAFNEDGEMFNVGETFAGLGLARGVELADTLKPLVPESMSMAAMAIRWILDHEAVTTVIPGASRPDQVRANAAVSDLAPLPASLHRKLQSWHKHERVEASIRGPY